MNTAGVCVRVWKVKTPTPPHVRHAPRELINVAIKKNRVDINALAFCIIYLPCTRVSANENFTLERYIYIYIQRERERNCVSGRFDNSIPKLY